MRPVIVKLWWCNSALSGIEPQLDLILSGRAEASVRQESQEWLQWEITGPQTDAGRYWLWSFKMFCVCSCAPAGDYRSLALKIKRKTGWKNSERDLVKFGMRQPLFPLDVNSGACAGPRPGLNFDVHVCLTLEMDDNHGSSVNAWGTFGMLKLDLSFIVSSLNLGSDYRVSTILPVF